MKHFDVAIIGSGPSGATTALKLAQKGISTVIIEKDILPRHKTCGGGFVYRGRKMLPVDIESVVERAFSEVSIYFSGQNMHLITKRERPIISMIVREDFDKLIVDEALKHGVSLMQGQKLIGLQFGEHITLQLPEQEITAKFVIAADGVLSPTAKMAGWKKDTRTLIPALELDVEVETEEFNRLKDEVRFDIDFIPRGYAWCFPKKNHLNIGIGLFQGKANIKQYYEPYLKFLGIEHVISEKFHGYQIPISARKDGFVKNNVFLIGDAAGFADPITAEGISNAIYSGLLAADAIIESDLEPKIAGKIYLEKLKEKLLPELESSHFLSRIFYGQTTIRNFFMKRSPQRFAEFFTDIFMGDKYYPKDIIKTVKIKMKESLSSLVK